MYWQRYHKVDDVNPQALVFSQPMRTISSKSRDPMRACRGECFASFHQVSIVFHGSRLSAESLQPLPLFTTIFALNVCFFPRQFLFMFFSSSHEKDSCHIRVRPTACQHLNESSLRQSGFHSEVLGFRILISFFGGSIFINKKCFFYHSEISTGLPS